MDLSYEQRILLWNALNFVMEPIVDASLRITITVVINFFFYYSLCFFRRVKLDWLFFPPLAILFGLAHYFVYFIWEPFWVLTSIAFAQSFFFALTLHVWKKAEAEQLDMLQNLNYIVKFMSLLFTMIMLKMYDDHGNILYFIIPVAATAAKSLSACDALFHPSAYNGTTAQNISVIRTFLEMMGYMVSPCWFTFKEFQSLPQGDCPKNWKWCKMMFWASLKATCFHIISFKYLSEGNLWPFHGCGVLVFLINAFQHRCTYYSLAHIAELDAIMLGIRNNTEHHYMFDFIGAETSVVITDFLSAFNIRMGLFGRNALSNGRLVEIFLLVGVTPILVIAMCSPTCAIMWMVFFMSMLTQLHAIKAISKGEGSLLRCFRFHSLPTFRDASGASVVPAKFRYVLIICNQFRLGALFNFRFAHRGQTVFITIAAMVADSSFTGSMLGFGKPKPPIVEPTRAQRRRRRRRY